MQFSTRSFFLAVTFYATLIAITFSMNNFAGLALMTFICMIVLPPFVQVGVFTTKGFRQAFFIGVAIGGMPHFLYSFVASADYYSTSSMQDFFAGDALSSWFELDEDSQYLMLGHLIGIGMASVGGLSGCISYGILHGFGRDKQLPEATTQNMATSSEK